MSKDRTVSVARVINASPSEIFDVLADPSRHAEFDGSGTVKGSRDDAPERLALGSKFGMNMRIVVPYAMGNTVVEFEEDRLIAWSHFGKHRWRYELEPHDEGTLVTETFDWSTSVAPWFIEAVGYPTRHEASIEQTLERLNDLVTRDRR